MGGCFLLEIIVSDFILENFLMSVSILVVCSEFLGVRFEWYVDFYLYIQGLNRRRIVFP